MLNLSNKYFKIIVCISTLTLVLVFVLISLLINSLKINAELDKLHTINEGLREEIQLLNLELSKVEEELIVVGEFNDRVSAELKEKDTIIDKLNKSIVDKDKQNEKLTNTNKLLLGEIEGMKAKSKVSRGQPRSDFKGRTNVSHTNTPPSTQSNGKKLLGTFQATAYTDDVGSQGKWVGQTATGMKPQVGVIAVDPKIIPLGTKLFVEGYGNAIAGDTGGDIKGNRVDLFMNNRSEAMKFGRKNVIIWIRGE